MHALIILPGNSVRNKKWGEAVSEYYGRNFDLVYVQNYDHWQVEDGQMDFDKEIKKLKDKIEELHLGSNITIFAKSAGSILAILAITKGVILPARCVFFGIPFDWAFTDIFTNQNQLADFRVSTIAFHNDDDPVADYAFTKKTIEEKGSGNIKLITTHGNDHGYFDFPLYDPFLN